MTKNKKNIPRPYNSWTFTEAEFKSHILKKLRLLTSWWKPKKKSLKSSCEKCWSKEKLKSDHIDPIVPVEGWEKTDDLFIGYNWNERLRRAFVDESKYQTLCVTCHNKKSKKENSDRRKFKQKKLW